MLGLYQCQDGFFGADVEVLSALRRLADIISPELANEEKFQDFYYGNTKDADELEAILVPWFFEQKKQEIMALFQERRAICGYVATIQDVVDNNPQLKERHSLVEMEHPNKAGKLPYFVPCSRFSEVGYRMFPAPLLGQHNEEIFSSWLDLAKANVAKLASEGVI